MAINLTSFTKQLTVFAVLLFIIHGLFTLLVPGRFIPFLNWAIPPFFYLVVLFSKLLLKLMTGGEIRRFGTHFISITVFRFLLYIGVLLAYSFVFPEDAISFIITFFVFYFAFTLFEVSFLYRELKNR